MRSMAYLNIAWMTDAGTVRRTEDLEITASVTTSTKRAPVDKGQDPSGPDFNPRGENVGQVRLLAGAKCRVEVKKRNPVLAADDGLVLAAGEAVVLGALQEDRVHVVAYQDPAPLGA